MESIEPTNLSAQISHRARGNPPATLAASAISNCFPGLEFDFRNIWKNLFEEIELHEAGVGESHYVVDVKPGTTAAAAGIQVFDQLTAVDNRPILGVFVAPEGGGPTNRTRALEYSNALADILTRAGQLLSCTFETETNGTVTVNLQSRAIFDGAFLREQLAEPGALTQSLCSPWQADYRECGCTYWAASRPDFVNAESDGQGGVTGHDWMQKGRDPTDEYRPDPPGGGHGSAEHISYDDLYRVDPQDGTLNWQRALRFIFGGKDET